MSKKKVLLRGVFINRDTNGEGVLKVGTTLIRVSTVMGILYKELDNMNQIRDMRQFMPYYPRGIADSWEFDDKLGNELLEVLDYYMKF